MRQIDEARIRDHLGESLRGAYVINGKPQLSGDLLLAAALGAGVKVSERLKAGDDLDAGKEPVKHGRPYSKAVQADFDLNLAQSRAHHFAHEDTDV